MSWLFSLALVEEFLQEDCSDGEQFAQLNVKHTQHKFWRADKMMDALSLSQFGLTCAVLTESHGEGLLTSYLEDFRARRSAMQPAEKIMLLTFGERCLELSERYNQESLFSPKTSVKMRSAMLKQTLPKLAIQRSECDLMPKTWAQITLGKDGGYLHTPTTKANWAAKSMQKHLCCRRMVVLFGKPSPTLHEWMMGFPAGWTDLKPLGMDKFQKWQEALLL